MHLWEIEPNQVSKDLKGKYVLLYGLPKAGKTTVAASFPRSVLFAFEHGYNFLPGVYPWDIYKWSDFKAGIRDLEDPRAKEMYDTVIIDTATIAWDYCEKHVCNAHGVTEISAIEWGKGYAEVSKEFKNALRQIVQAGYGLVLIAHSAKRIEKDKDGNEREILSPDLNKRALPICNEIVDIIGYIGSEFDEEGHNQRYLYTRSTPTIFAGSRLAHLAPKIPYSYEHLVNAIAEAVDKGGATPIDTSRFEATLKQDAFEDLMDRARDLWNTFKDTPEKIVAIKDAMTQILGEGKKISDLTIDDKDKLRAIVDKMESLN